MVIALVANKNWYKYLVIDLYSLLESTKDVKKIYLFTETDNVYDILYLDKIINKYNNVEFEIINSYKVIDKNLSEFSVNKNSFFTDFCMVKLMLSNSTKEDKILYIDTDAIVKKDISNIWDLDIEDYYIAGVRDFGILKRGSEEVFDIADTYINSGFVLFNLKKMRKDKIQEKMFEILNTKFLRFPDQDALNLVCCDKILLLPSIYNLCEDVSLEVKNRNLVKVFHFAGVKDFWVANRYYAEEWYEVEEKFNNEFVWSYLDDDMVDIIIPAYNAHKYIENTLDSILKQQNSDKINVYVVDDFSDSDYNYLKDIYKNKLNLNILRLRKNSGPGKARQYGLEHSKSKYVIFLDSDDLLYDDNCIFKMVLAMDSSFCDVISARMVEEDINSRDIYYVGFDTLHAKIYRRSFLEDKKIKFPSSYNSEDIAFNNLVILNTTNIGQIDNICYLYKRRKDSLTKTNDYYANKHIRCYCENLRYVIEMAEVGIKNKIVNKVYLANLLKSTFCYFFWYFYNSSDQNIKYIYDFIPDYDRYIKFADEDVGSYYLNWWTSRIKNENSVDNYEKFMLDCHKKYSEYRG